MALAKCGRLPTTLDSLSDNNADDLGGRNKMPRRVYHSAGAFRNGRYDY